MICVTEPIIIINITYNKELCEESYESDGDIGPFFYAVADAEDMEYYTEEVIEWQTKTSRTFGSRIILGALSYTLTPPGSPPTSKYYQRHSQRRNSSGARATGWANSGANSQALSGACQRRAIRGVSLSPTVAGNLGTEQIRRVGKGRGERERKDKGVGVGSVWFARGR